MNRVNIPVTSFASAWRFWRTRVFANPVSVAAAASAAVVLGGSLAASAAWAAAHQDQISGVVPWVLNQGQQFLTQSLTVASATLEQQSWYAPLKAALTPGRLAAVGTTAMPLYGAGVVAM